MLNFTMSPCYIHMEGMYYLVYFRKFHVNHLCLSSTYFYLCMIVNLEEKKLIRSIPLVTIK